MRLVVDKWGKLDLDVTDQIHEVRFGQGFVAGCNYLDPKVCKTMALEDNMQYDRSCTEGQKRRHVVSASIFRMCGPSSSPASRMAGAHF